MKKILLLTILSGASMLALSQERGQVLTATPIVEQIAVPRQVCGNETVYTGPRTSGGGAVLGAIAGGAAGNAIGGGSGRAAATALGLIGGAFLGNHIEGNGRPEYQNVQRCGTETAYENRTTGYDVVYEYAGQRYTTRTQSDPGPYINVRVVPEEPRAYRRNSQNDRNGYYQDPRYDGDGGGYAERGGTPYAGRPVQGIAPGVTVIEYDGNQRRPYDPYAPSAGQWR